MVQLTARGTHTGEGTAKQESQEAISTYYVDLPSDEEEGATAEVGRQPAQRLGVTVP